MADLVRILLVCCILLFGLNVLSMRSQNWERQVAMDNLEAQLVIEKADIGIRYLLSIGVERQTAEDLTGEAIYNAILYFEGIDPEKLKAGLFRVALNGYYDILKKNRRQVLYGTVDLDKISRYLGETNRFEGLFHGIAKYPPTN